MDLQEEVQIPSAHPAGANDSIFLPTGIRLAKSDGRFVAGPTYDGGLAVLDDAGDFVSVIGRRGQGPGDFPGEMRVLRVGAGGLVFALHVGRLSVLDLVDPGIVDQIGLFAPLYDVVPLGQDRLIGQPDVSTLLSQGSRWYSLTADGEVEEEVALPTILVRTISPALGHEDRTERYTGPQVELGHHRPVQLVVLYGVVEFGLRRHMEFDPASRHFLLPRPPA